MHSAWIIKRKTKPDGRNKGRPRYIVRYRLRGRDSSQLYGGSFRTEREALIRKRWIDGELLAGRKPVLSLLAAEPERAPTLARACDEWRASRVDVSEATRVLHRVALGRVVPSLGTLRVDEMGETDVQRLVQELASTGRKRETIRKSVKYLAAVLDEHGIDPNPARSRKVRLPHEESRTMARRHSSVTNCWRSGSTVS